MRELSGRVTPVAIAHQEGVIGLVAVVGLGLGSVGPAAAFGARSGLLPAVTLGVACGLGAAAVAWFAARLPFLSALESWQRQLVAGWSASEAVAVALLSGLAEEALCRAVLQPRLGLAAAALLFAVLHVVPEARLWSWPLLALLLGLGFGYLYERAGFPAAAAAHVAVNLVGLLRLRHAAAGKPGRSGCVE
jgi:membrane protease YdiL (CAAX protease family)